jgi:hypothetical protein
MNPIPILLIPIILLAGCTARQTEKAPPAEPYRMVDYVEVGKGFDTVRTPYVIDLKNGYKRLVFVGCEHTRDTAHPQFAAIERYFSDLEPQIAFNEGGQIKDSVRYRSRSEAAAHNGETGCLKYFSDRAGIRMMNGDLADSAEFAITLRKHPREELFLYYVMERIVQPYLMGMYGKGPFEETYERYVKEWFVAKGFPLAPEERSAAHFKELFRKHIGVPFKPEISVDNIEKFDYINGGDCKFCAIGRTSKVVRDSVLLTRIDQALDRYDRVLVTFGHGHALAVEPALHQIIEKQRAK